MALIVLARSFPRVFPYLHFLTIGRHQRFHLSGDALHTTVFGQFFFLNSVAKSWLFDFRGYCLKESWTQVVSCTKKKNGVEFLSGLHNLGYLPHELLSPECDDCCNCVVDGLSPSGFEGGGLLMWRLPVWSKVSNSFRWNAVNRPISELTSRDLAKWRASFSLFTAWQRKRVRSVGCYPVILRVCRRSNQRKGILKS